MSRCLFTRLTLVCGGTLASVLVGPAVGLALAAGNPSDTSGCSDPVLSQPFVSAGDSNWYTLVSGQTPDNFTGDGWTLDAAASVGSSELANGHTGSVLDLPSGSTAVSPPVCVNSGYPTARAMIRNVSGTQGVRVYASYAGPEGWDKPQQIGRVDGIGQNWTLSDTINIRPGKGTGWRLLRFTLVAGGRRSESQFYNLYVDPRMGA